MRRRWIMGLLGVLALPAAVWAGNPHFVSLTAERFDNSLTVSGKEAGLGDEQDVHIIVYATAECINPGQHHPKAANKESVSAEGDFPVTNGKADFSLTVTASFQPDCSPPMTVVFTDILVVDVNNGIQAHISGTF